MQDSANLGVRVQGGARLRRTLRAAGVDMTQLKALNLDAATVVTSAAAGSVPRRSGKLAASLRPGATQKAGVAKIGGARVPYANAIHWGWRARNIKSNRFLVTAGHATENQWRNVYTQGIDQILSQVQGA